MRFAHLLSAPPRKIMYFVPCHSAAPYYVTNDNLILKLEIQCNAAPTTPWKFKLAAFPVISASQLLIQDHCTPTLTQRMLQLLPRNFNWQLFLFKTTAHQLRLNAHAPHVSLPTTKLRQGTGAVLGLLPPSLLFLLMTSWTIHDLMPVPLNQNCPQNFAWVFNPSSLVKIYQFKCMSMYYVFQQYQRC